MKERKTEIERYRKREGRKEVVRLPENCAASRT